MSEVTVKVSERPLPGGRAVKAALYEGAHGGRLLVLACGFGPGDLADIADPEQRDRLALPGAALPLLREALSELDADE